MSGFVYRPSAKTRKEIAETPNDGFAGSQMDEGEIHRPRRRDDTVGVFEKRSVVHGQPIAGAAGHQPRPCRKKDDYFFTTNVNMKSADVLAAYANRWAIEDTFKHTKQHLGPHQPQTWARQGPERAAALGLWLYSTVWLWFCKQPAAKRRFRILPWHASKTTIPPSAVC